MKLVHLAYEISIAENGRIEFTNSNDNPKILEYLKSVGINHKTSYCAAGIYWSFKKASDSLKIRKIPIPQSAVANDWFNYSIKYGNKSNRKPQKYDLLVWRKKNSWQGHIEWICDFKNGILTTFGFNVMNIKTGKEGVFYKKRFLNHPLGRLAFRGIIGFRE